MHFISYVVIHGVMSLLQQTLQDGLKKQLLHHSMIVSEHNGVLLVYIMLIGIDVLIQRDIKQLQTLLSS